MAHMLMSIVFFVTSYATAKSIQFEKSWVLPAAFKVDGLKVGGLSGCTKKNDQIYFISDDHGGEGGSRIVSFKWNSDKNDLDLLSGKNLIIKNPQSLKILDLEGIGMNSKGEFLLSNEGDMNKKPRQAAEIFWADQNGERLRDIKLTDEFLPNLIGQQTKGTQNNFGFEGLSIDLDLQKWGAFLEAPIVTGFSRTADALSFIESDIESTKVDQKFSYPLPRFEGESITFAFGVTDFLYLSGQELLVLERGVELSIQGIQFDSQLCLAQKDKQNLTRQCSYIFNNDKTLIKTIKKAANFEGLCWMNEKKTQFLVVSDNNFSKSENTVFLLYNLN